MRGREGVGFQVLSSRVMSGRKGAVGVKQGLSRILEELMSEGFCLPTLIGD